VKTLFRFKGEDGEDASVVLDRIIGFGHRWPESDPIPEPLKSTISIDAHHGMYILGSTEPQEELERRYNEMVSAPWDAPDYLKRLAEIPEAKP
jgi:hypothetical protein